MDLYGLPADCLTYEPYHPHLTYTLVVTGVAWVTIALYGWLGLRTRPQQRSALFGLAIALPVYAELASLAIYFLRPAPDTVIGAFLACVHHEYIQPLNIDTYLSPTLTALLVGSVAVLTWVSVIRYAMSVLDVRRRLIGARPLAEAGYTAIEADLAAVAERVGRPLPPVLVIGSSAPLVFTTGVWRPRIYLSAVVFSLLRRDEVVAAICHEWAHIQRRDGLWNLIMRILRDGTLFLGGGYVFWRWMLASQEEASDALGGELSQQPYALARALVKVTEAWRDWEQLGWPGTTNLFGVPQAGLPYRVERLISLAEETEPARYSRGAIRLAATLLLLAVLPAILGS